MSWFKKLLGLKEKSEEEVKQEEVQQAFTQPKGNLVGQCLFCQLAIGDEDAYSKLPRPEGAIVHKRCVKKAQRAALNGENPEKIFAQKVDN